MRSRPRRVPIILALVVAVALSSAITTVATGALQAGRSEPPVSYDKLGAARNPVGAPGRTLTLSHVAIPRGVKLALHRHEGTQVSHVQRGVLTYTVKTGVVHVRRNRADGRSRIVRTIRAGQTGTIRAGEWIVEQPNEHHSAVNRGRQTVVVYLATLLRNGAPPSTPVD